MPELLPLPSYLLCSYGKFFFRMRVPKDLQHILKKKELKKAIRTTDVAIASRQAIIYAARAFELFSALQEQEVTLADYPFFNKMVLLKMPDGVIEFRLDKDRTDEELNLLIAKGIISPSVNNAASNPQPPPDIPPFAQPSQSTSKQMLLSEAVNQFMEARQKRQSKRNSNFDEKAARDPFNMLTEFLGADVPIESITSDHANLFYDKLKLLPRLRTHKARRGLSFTQLINLRDKDVISENTHGQHIGKISGLWHWLNDSDTLKLTNPWYGMADKKIMHRQAAIKKRLAFDATDVQKIFNHQIFTQKLMKYDWDYWFPLLLIHSGARVNEICQLEKKDLVTVDGIPCISINDIATKDEPDTVWDESPKRVKTANSRREIPVHSNLINLGFQRFVESAKSGRLFPDIKPVAKKLSHKPCKRFNEKLLVEMGVKVPFLKTFYSFRHTVMNELKQRRVNLEERGQLAGHSPMLKVTSGYGDEFSMADMKALVEMLDFSTALQNVLPW